MATALWLAIIVIKKVADRRANRLTDAELELKYPIPDDDEFKMKMSMYHSAELNRFRRAFKHCDSEDGGDGKVDKSEMTLVVREFNADSTEDEVKKLVDDFFLTADKDGGGEIEFKEFMEAIYAASQSGGTEADFAAMVQQVQMKATKGQSEVIFTLFLLLTFLVLISSSSTIFNYLKCDRFPIPEQNGGGAER